MNPSRILIVDDDTALADSFAKYFKRHGWDAEAVYSGEQAIELMQKESFDGMILDMVMGGIDGIGVLKYIKEQKLDICVIIRTGHKVTIPDTVEAMQLGAWDYFIKAEVADYARMELSLKHGIEKMELQRLISNLYDFGLHDLKNPLMIISWVCNFLQDRAKEMNNNLTTLNDAFKPFETAAKAMTKSLQSKLNDLTEFCKISCNAAAYAEEIVLQLDDTIVLQNDVLELKKENFELGKFFEETLKTQVILAKDKAITFAEPLILDGLTTMYADRRYIKRVLNNLIHNAIKYACPGQVGIQARRDQKFMQVSVCDEGPGIDRAFRQKVFIKGYTSGKGKGYGLAFCKMVVEAHGGTIWVEDNPATPNRGCCFVFTIPIPEST